LGATVLPAATREVESAFEPWLQDPDALLEAIRNGARGFEASFDRAQHTFSLMRGEQLACAVLDRDGNLLFANELFAKAIGVASIDLEVARNVANSRRSVTAHASGSDPSLARAVVAYGAMPEALSWVLPEEVRGAACEPGAAIVVLAVAAMSAANALEGACRAYGLTDLQTRVAIGLVKTGDVRGAAVQAGVAYQTARKVAADALKRVGVARLPALIERLVRLSFGVWPVGREGEAILSDVWGLTERQAELALRLAHGMTRAEAARAGGMSEAVAKKQIDVIFAALEVSSATELARCVTEARALALLTAASGSAVLPHGEALEPLRIIRRLDGGHVAYSDYGPQGGQPVLVLHSSTASRHAPLTLVRALQADGFRPIAMDRPGFGLSDPMADLAAWRSDPFGNACDDVELLCRHFKIERIDLIARGGAQVAIELAKRFPHRLGRVVLVNPDPPTEAHGRRSGPLGAVKDTFYRFPALVERMAWTLSRNLTTEKARSLVLRTVRTSPPDVALMQQDAFYADYARGFRLFASGRVAGYVAEQIAMTRWRTEPLPHLSHWRILLSEVDPLHDPDEVRAYWSRILPGALQETVPETGRFLVMARPDNVVAALKAARPAA
jgi:pimeloyl-ACP methyl ester carboxylesterase/DNA-binding CsgD family transcriptional regulator